MRILAISTLFPNPARPSFGIFVGSQMRAASKIDDVDLTVISPIGIPPWPLSLAVPYKTLRSIPKQSEVSGINAYYPRFTLIPRIGGDSNPDRIYRAIAPLVRKLHAEQPFDLIDASFFFPDGPVVSRIAVELDLPFTIKSRGSDIHYWGGRPAALKQMLDAAHKASGLLAVSQALKTDMVNLGMPKDKTHIHYTGLDRERFHPKGRSEARSALAATYPGLSQLGNAPLIATAGALIPRKGQSLVIKALTNLPDTHLALAGTGEDEASLRDLASQLGLAQRVHFLGLVNHTAMPNLLCAANAVVLPSHSEGLANAWVEALACGTPLVLSNVGGAQELMTNDAAGRMVDRTPEAIAAAVSDILVNPPSQEAVAATVAAFSWEANGAKIAEIWRELIRVQ